jgi:hypothetical protein
VQPLKPLIDRLKSSSRNSFTTADEGVPGLPGTGSCLPANLVVLGARSLVKWVMKEAMFPLKGWSPGPATARAAIFKGLGGVDVGASSSSFMHAEHDGEQGSLVVAVAVVVVAVVASPLHAVTVLHCVVVWVWTLVVEPEIEVESTIF